MTTIRMIRCTHCKIEYGYHPSCYGFITEFNDKKYCSECLKVINGALKNVSVKFKKKFVATTDYTRGEIVAAQEKRVLKKVLTPTRVPVHLFDLKDSSNQQHKVCEMMRNPASGKKVYYIASWRLKEPNKVEIVKEIWWDILNNKPA